ncbi:MAG: L-fucose/L-arabinose isomerase family protein [Rhizobiaceae bacterium]
MRIGLLPLGRPTFDVDYANEKLGDMLAALDATPHEIVGPRDMLMDGEATDIAVNQLKSLGIDRLLVLQVTFTDAAAIVTAAKRLDKPLSIWAIPEPRLGGRLRLNAFCGLNLASHALGLINHEFSWLYVDAGQQGLERLFENPKGGHPKTEFTAVNSRGRDIAAAISGNRIARIGEHPEGFHTCAYDPLALDSLAGVSVDKIELFDLFESAKKAGETETAKVRTLAESALSGLDEVDQDELDRSLKLKVALDDLKSKGGYDAFAIRCWPETFTEYGGAVCGAVSMMGDARSPCACEADVYGALTQMILQEAAQAPVFLTDLVDVDIEDDTAVVWHCGQAPISMRAGNAKATIHTNRKMPLLYEFTLKPGIVTLMRISQALGETKMILSTAKMLDRPMAFTGTSGVMRFEQNAKSVLDKLIASGMEHHMALAYGDHTGALSGTAAALDIPVLRL